MLYRLDELAENNTNPITGRPYDNTWRILTLTDSRDYQQMCGSQDGCAYTIKINRCCHPAWEISVCDFIGFCEATHKNMILAMSGSDLKTAQKHCGSHKYNDTFLRENEPPILIHSTPLEHWEQIKRDGMLKSWNILKKEKILTEKRPIGSKLNDPEDFSDYIMFGSGMTGEIIVNSKQHGDIIMDENAEYLTGARLYFDARKMAGDGLLLRDGCHIKVKDKLPLAPYLVWVATWETLGLPERTSTPKIFTEQADQQFILMNENICRPECITSERTGSVEQKAADKCVHEYKIFSRQKTQNTRTETGGTPC